MGYWWSGAESSTNIGNLSPPSGPPGGGSATAGIGQAYQSSGQSMNEWIQEALGPTGDVRDVPGVETVDYTSMSEADKWDWLYNLQSQWETEQDPLGTGNLGVSSPFALTYQDLGNPQGLAWQAALPNEPGAQEINGEWKKPILSGLGQRLFEREEGLPSLGGEGASQELMDISEDYYATRTEQEQLVDQGQAGYGYGYDPGGGGGYAGGPGGGIDVKRFSRGRPENINPWWQNKAGTPMLPVAGSGAGGSLATRDILTQLAAGAKAFSRTPKEQGILALLNA